MKISYVALVLAVLGLSACGASIGKTSAPGATTQSPCRVGYLPQDSCFAAAGPTTAAPTMAAPSPSSSPSGRIGAGYTVTDDSGNKISVTLTRVIDPAQGAGEFTSPDAGKRFVGAVSAIRGISGSVSDDADNDASLIGSNGQTYSADFNSIAGVTDFNNGEFSVSAGERSVGAVTFQVPLGVKVAIIEWSANSGLGGPSAEWITR